MEITKMQSKTLKKNAANAVSDSFFSSLISKIQSRSAVRSFQTKLHFSEHSIQSAAERASILNI
jgi:hypothetical protein